MTTVLDQVTSLDNFKAVRLVEHLSDLLADDLELDALLDATPRHFLDAGISNAPALASRVSEQLSPQESIAVSRAVLRALASEPATSAIVSEALASLPDDRMLAAEILSLGAAMSMVIVACTTTFSFRGKRFLAGKKTATPELIKAIGKVFTGASKEGAG